MTLQSRIDAKAYPPTHCYELATLAPRGVLADRVWIFDRLVPDFWKGKRLLDVGANKGYFSARGLSSGMQVVALDPDAEATELCRDIGARTVTSGFRDTGLFENFDRVFVGNGPHYLYAEAGGWEFLDKIAALTEPNGLVVLEGMTEESPDLVTMSPPMPEKIRAGYTNAAMLHAARKRFDVVAQEPATAYTPGRVVTVLRRGPGPMNRAVDIAGAQYVQGPTPTGHVVVYRRDNQFLKIVGGGDRCTPVWMERSVAFASLPKWSTGPREVYRDEDGEFRGWSEVVIPGEKLPKFSAKALAAWCRRNRYLAKLGYVDLDSGPANFIEGPLGLWHVDKNATFPIRELDSDVTDWPEGRLWRTAQLWYPITVKVVALFRVICAALAAGDPSIVESAFAAGCDG